MTPPQAFGVVYHDFTYNSGTTQLTDNLAAVNSLGATYYRFDVPWNAGYSASGNILEATIGDYSSAAATQLATLVAAIKAAGLIPVPVITQPSFYSFGSPTLSDGYALTYTNPTTGIPTGYSQFGDCMVWLVAQTGLQGLHWELLNEPDVNGTTPGAYAAMINYTYPKMVAADPTCRIHWGVTACLDQNSASSPIPNSDSNSTRGPTGYDWISSFYTAIQSSTYGSWHIATSRPWHYHSFHLYSEPGNEPYASGWSFGDGSLVNAVSDLISLRSSVGDSAPLWCTEMGWEYTNSSGSGVTCSTTTQHDNGLAWLTYVADNFPQISAIFWYELITGGGQYFGLWQSGGPPLATENPIVGGIQSLGYVNTTGPAPTVTGVSPASGSTTGGTPVTITGTGFTGATVVNFGTTAAASLSVIASTQIDTTSPAHAVGAVDITVVTPNGTSATSAADQFTFTSSGMVGVTFGGSATSGDSYVTGSAASVLAVFLGTVTSGQPIVIFLRGVYSNQPTPSFSDNFTTSYTYTQVDAAFESTNGVDTRVFIATGGTGTSGTITINSEDTGGYWSAAATPCIGASTKSGLAAVDQHGNAHGFASTMDSPSLTPTNAGEGALYSVGTDDSSPITSYPTTPWASTAGVNQQNTIAIYQNPSPPHGTALATSWASAAANNYAAVGILILDNSIVPSAASVTVAGFGPDRTIIARAGSANVIAGGNQPIAHPIVIGATANVVVQTITEVIDATAQPTTANVVVRGNGNTPPLSKLSSIPGTVLAVPSGMVPGAAPYYPNYNLTVTPTTASVAANTYGNLAAAVAISTAASVVVAGLTPVQSLPYAVGAASVTANSYTPTNPYIAPAGVATVNITAASVATSIASTPFVANVTASVASSPADISPALAVASVIVSSYLPSPLLAGNPVAASVIVTSAAASVVTASSVVATPTVGNVGISSYFTPTSASPNVTTEAAAAHVSILGTAPSVATIATAGNANAVIAGFAPTQQVSGAPLNGVASVSAYGLSTAIIGIPFTANAVALGIGTVRPIRFTSLPGSALAAPANFVPGDLPSTNSSPQITFGTGAASVVVGSYGVITTQQSTAGVGAASVASYAASIATTTTAATASVVAIGYETASSVDASVGQANTVVAGINPGSNWTSFPATASVSATSYAVIPSSGTVVAAASVFVIGYGIGPAIASNAAAASAAAAGASATGTLGLVASLANAIVDSSQVVIASLVILTTTSVIATATDAIYLPPVDAIFEILPTATHPTLRMSSQSTDYIRASLLVTVPPGIPYDLYVDDVYFAFIGPYATVNQAAENEPTASTNWYQGSWSTDISSTARILIGPYGGATVLSPGSYQVYVKVVDNPEIAVLLVGPLVII